MESSIQQTCVEFVPIFCFSKWLIECKHDNMWQLRNLILAQTLSPIFNASQKIKNRWNGVFHPIGLVFHGISQHSYKKLVISIRYLDSTWALWFKFKFWLDLRSNMVIIYQINKSIVFFLSKFFLILTLILWKANNNSKTNFSEIACNLFRSLEWWRLWNISTRNLNMFYLKHKIM